MDDRGIIKFWDRVRVPDVPELKRRILEEAHRNGLNVHLGATKKCKDLKRMF